MVILRSARTASRIVQDVHRSTHCVVQIMYQPLVRHIYRTKPSVGSVAMIYHWSEVTGPDEVKSSAGVTIDAAEWNSNLATKAKHEFKKSNRENLQASSTKLCDTEEKQAEKEIVARAGSSITATKIKRMSWDERHMQLQMYKVEHGDCLVPRKYKNQQLALWVVKQRSEYTKYKRGHPSSMTKKRIAELEAVDFVWDAQEFAWKSNVMEMIVYREIYGDCLVPRGFALRPTLGLWVMKQRTEYEKFQKQQPSQMTQARIERLVAEEFVWQVYIPWDDRYNELLEYQRTHGNCRVPQRFAANPQLGIWVNTQRTEYRKLKNGEKSHITAERVQKLNDIGFVWNWYKVNNAK